MPGLGQDGTGQVIVIQLPCIFGANRFGWANHFAALKRGKDSFGAASLNGNLTENGNQGAPRFGLLVWAAGQDQFP